MGGGKEKQKTNNMVDQNANQNQQEHEQNRGSIDPTGAIAQADQSRGGMDTGIRDYAGADFGVHGSYGVDPNMGKVNGNFNVDPTKYRQVANYDESRGLYRDFAKNGGYDQDAASTAHPLFQQQISDSGIGDKFRANGTYDEFARTGGLSDQDRTNIRTRATSTIPSMFSSMNRQADQQAAVQGGYGPGNAALKSRMLRDTNAGMANASLNAELGITDQVNQGRQWGAAGMTGAEGAYQGMRQGAGNSLDTSARDIQGHVQGGKMFGTSGVFGVEQGINDIERANMDRMSGIDVGNQNRSVGLANANADRGVGISTGNANRQVGVDTGNANRMMDQAENVVSSNANLMQSDRDYASGLAGMRIGETGQNAGIQQGYTDQRMRNNPQRNWLGTVVGLGGTAAGLMTGAGAMR